MDGLDTTDRFEQTTIEQSPSLLTIVLDTNPAAWVLLSDTLPLSAVVANLLVFINAHLACNYTNKVAVIASHPDKAQWLYPPTQEQLTSESSLSKDDEPRPAKRAKLNGAHTNGDLAASDGSKYRPFRLIETALLKSLTSIFSTTTPDSLDPSSSTSTMIAGALTLALSYINREANAYSESIVGVATDPSAQQTADTSSPARLQSRILLISASPTTDLAHQYIPIMNAIFACQRLSIPIDILAIPLPSSPTSTAPPSTATGTPAESSTNSTVFLQQASDATNGIYLPFVFPPSPSPTPASSSNPTKIPTNTSTLLQLLLGPLLPSPLTRQHLTSPTLINIDFRAACFCHRRVIDLGYVCSICLSIFCEPPAAPPTADEGGVLGTAEGQKEVYECLTCGTQLQLGEGVGRKPVVVPQKRRKKKAAGKGRGGMGGEMGGGSRLGTPVPG